MEHVSHAMINARSASVLEKVIVPSAMSVNILPSLKQPKLKQLLLV
jgi:hypothetical protein